MSGGSRSSTSSPVHIDGLGDGPEPRREFRVIFVAEVLAGKDQHTVTVVGILDEPPVRIIERFGQIDVADLGGEFPGDRPKLRGHGSLPNSPPRLAELADLNNRATASPGVGSGTTRAS